MQRLCLIQKLDSYDISQNNLEAVLYWILIYLIYCMHLVLVWRTKADCPDLQTWPRIAQKFVSDPVNPSFKKFIKLEPIQLFQSFIQNKIALIDL